MMHYSEHPLPHEITNVNADLPSMTADSSHLLALQMVNHRATANCEASSQSFSQIMACEIIVMNC